MTGFDIYNRCMALMGYTFESKLFLGFILADICLPILFWIYIWLFGKLMGKHTIASLDLMQDKKSR